MSDVELEPAWHGAWWRTFPPPVIGTDPHTPNTPRRVARMLTGQSQHRAVIAAVTDDWERGSLIAARAGVESRRAHEYLTRGITRGQVERQRGPKQQTGASFWVYRRRRPITGAPEPQDARPTTQAGEDATR